VNGYWVMASASSTSAKNLFQDSKQRLSDRVKVNINNIGSLTRQIQRGSKSNEILAQTTKNFCNTESSISNTQSNLERMQVLVAQLSQQQESVETTCDKITQVKEQVRDLQR